jgi:hypothetical protein
MAQLELPKEYVPYEEMRICGNLMLNGKAPITVDGRPVFLFGKASLSSVWLQVPTGKHWRYEISNGQSDDSAYKVSVSGSTIAVYFGPHLLIRAERKSDTALEIDHVDLTKFGLAIHGDSSSLWVGGMTISGNTFEGVGTMINVAKFD